MVFLINFFIDLAYSNTDEYQSYKNVQIVTRSLGGAVLLYFFIYELMQWRALGTRHYFTSELWTYSDLLLCVCYAAYITGTIVLFENEDDSKYYLKAIRCAIVFFAFLKVTFYLRIFDQMSFLV